MCVEAGEILSHNFFDVILIVPVYVWGNLNTFWAPTHIEAAGDART